LKTSRTGPQSESPAIIDFSRSCDFTPRASVARGKRGFPSNVRKPHRGRMDANSASQFLVKNCAFATPTLATTCVHPGQYTMVLGSFSKQNLCLRTVARYTPKSGTDSPGRFNISFFFWFLFLPACALGLMSRSPGGKTDRIWPPISHPASWAVGSFMARDFVPARA